MVAIARGSLGVNRDQLGQPFRVSKNGLKSSESSKDKSILPPWVNTSKKPGTPLDDKRCYYRREIGHIKRNVTSSL